MSLCLEHAESHVEGLREAFFRHVRTALERGLGHVDPPLRTALTFLAKWGFDATRLDHLDVGFFPSPGMLREALLHDGFPAEEIAASHLLGDPRLAGRLVGPIRDVQGRIISFWARNPERPDDRTLYLSGGWKQETAVFGLDAAHFAVAEDRQDLLLVEDLFDALLWHGRHVQNVAAIGGSAADMTEVRWQRLAELGIHRVTLIPDGPQTSSRAMLAAIGRMAHAQTAPAVYVLPPETLAEGSEPDRLVRTLAPDALADLLARERVHGFRYKASCLIARHKPDGEWTDAARHALVSEAVEFYGAVHQRCIPQLDLFFLPAILEELGLGWSGSSESDSLAWNDDRPPVEPEDSDAPGDALMSLDAAGILPVFCEDATGAAIPGISPVFCADTQDILPDAVGLSPPPVAEDPPASPPPAEEPPPPPAEEPASDFCEIHQCSRNECLCWD
jgi:hypothetical protein